MFIVSLMISDSVADNMSTHSNFSLYVRYLPGLKGRSSSGAIMGKWMPVAIKQVDFLQSLRVWLLLGPDVVSTCIQLEDRKLVQTN